MNEKPWQVPWHNGLVFDEAVRFFAVVDRQRGRALDPVRRLAQGIEQALCRISDDMEQLCRITCPDCMDNCCERAMVWYDFKDLLYLHFGPGRLPGRQIVKSRNLGTNGCPNLGDTGCCLPRFHRPFVCTWYLCAAQKQCEQGRAAARAVAEIKAMRNLLEDMFCNITG